MNVASLELCRELYELSGWGIARTDKLWRFHEPTGHSKLVWTEEQKADDYRFRNSPEATRFRQENAFYPAYDLGYLLRKLPANKGAYYLSLKVIKHRNQNLNGWEIGYKGCWGFADTPEDAACGLAIELFKRGILTKGGADD